MEFVVTCMPGLGPWLAEELRELKLSVVDERAAAVYLDGPLEQGLRVCLQSRLAERVLHPLARVDEGPDTAPELLARAWSPEEHLRADTPIHVHAEHRGLEGDSRVSAHRFLRVCRETLDVSTKAAGALNLRLELTPEYGSLYLDLAGEALHRRGYRTRPGDAPLRETLATALLRASGWPHEGDPVLLDPFCGSGTIAIEAAEMALGLAPGRRRREFAFQQWRACPDDLWPRLLRARPEAQVPEGLSIKAFDADTDLLRAARANAEAAGVAEHIHFERRELGLLRKRDFAAGGHLVTNPPWGRRLEDRARAACLHTALGQCLAELAPEWTAVLLGTEVEVLDQTGMTPDGQWKFRNGAERCFIRRMHPVRRAPEPPLCAGEPAFEVPDKARSLVNRLRKNDRHLRKWREREDIQAYRLYDRDLPEFNVTVDIYGRDVLVQEYKAPKSVDAAAAAERRQLAITAVRAVLGAHREQVHLRTRAPQKPGRQYGKGRGEADLRPVREGDVRLLVNLEKYLDTGLFLDHRPLRLHIAEQAFGQRFLNLFGYTGAATVHAARGGAASSVTLDSSRTYLDWAGRNLALNGFSTRYHKLERGEALEWLEQCRRQFDLIFCDPPTFSNSKDRRDFAVQRDHAELIRLAMTRLEPGGVLYFSCNYRPFELDASIRAEYRVSDITRWSLPPDFERNSGIHHCFAIRRNDDGD